MSKRKPLAASWPDVIAEGARVTPERAPGRCIHFTDMRHSECGAGVAYASVRVSHDPLTNFASGSAVPIERVTSLPCLDQINPARCSCPMRQLPTAEEIEATRGAGERLLDLQLQLRRTLLKTGLGDGSVTCPKCAGTVEFTNREGRGVWAKCVTPGCLNFQD